MKKLIIALVAGFMLSFAGAPALAYEPTTDTDVTPKTKGADPKPGEKKRFIVKPGVQGDAAQCTGEFRVIYKAGTKVVRDRSKPVGNRVAFNGKVPAGTTKIVFLYVRGKKDPCDKSSENIKL